MTAGPPDPRPPWGGPVTPPAPAAPPGWQGPVPGGMPPWQQPPPRSTRPLRWLLIAGLVVLAGAAAAIVRGATTIDTGEITDLVDDPASLFTVRMPHPGTRTVRLSEGRYWFFAVGDDLVDRSGSEPSFGDSRTRFAEPQITVRGPGGPVRVTDPGEDVTFSSSGTDVVLVASVRVPRDGRYTIRARGGAQRVTEVGAGRTDILWHSAKTILGPAAWIVGGVVLGLLGVALVGIALILWLVGRRRPGPPAG